MPIEFILGVFIGTGIGICLMSLLQIGRISNRDKKIEILEHKIEKILRDKEILEDNIEDYKKMIK